LLRIRTFDFEREGIAAMKPSEQYFQDSISRILLALSMKGDPAFE
jgi:hypothetical protein